MEYSMNTIMHSSFEIAVYAVKTALPNFGFGVVSEFDIDAKLREKLNVDFRSYKIIGACNPKYAYEALLAEPLIGTMLPCNIVVQEIAPNQIQIAAIDPVASMMAVDNPLLKEAAKEIKKLLQELIDSLN
ncbi:MAG: DUF302 domain-containing protein [Salinivirgaceae bacterium]|nr:DUF302 domain-containing protein [Salinivirgaceae bacterium]